MKVHDRKRKPERHRGVAMLLVMIALVVCSVLVTGFLAGQGTSNGIAKNEAEYARAQRAAETGANMCIWLLRTRNDWRSSMTPGTWLSNVSVGSSTVTVTAADAKGNSSFLTDPTHGAVFTSVGMCNGRTATLVATAQPTGGGTVFYGGTFLTGNIRMDHNGLMDSFNWVNGPYSILTNVASNALVGTSSAANGAFEMDDLAMLFGSAQIGVGGIVGNVLNLVFGVLAPASVSNATEFRTPGETIPPNTTGLVNRPGTLYQGTVAGPSTGVYTSINVSPPSPPIGTTNVTMAAATVRISGNLTVASGTKVKIPANTKVIFQVDGNVTWSGSLVMDAGATALLYVGGNFTSSGGQMNYNGGSGGVPAGLTVMGFKTSGGLTFKGGAQFYGSVFAPQSDVVMQDTSQIYGGIVGKSLRITDSAKLHWDDNLKKKNITNITNGSAPPGTPIYTISYQWNP
jgi:Tfp pilus assembly protein PilV